MKQSASAGELHGDGPTTAAIASAAAAAAAAVLPLSFTSLTAALHIHKHGHHHRHAPRQAAITSAEANGRVNAALKALYDRHRPGGPKALKWSTVATRVARHLLRIHATAVLTVACLVCAAAFTSPQISTVPLLLCVTIFAVYGALLALEAFHLFARSVEMHRRILCALEEFAPGTGGDAAVTPPLGSTAVDASPGMTTTGPPAARVIEPVGFHGAFAGLRGLLPCRSFHLRQVFRDGKYVAMPKALIVEGDDVLVPRLALASSHRHEDIGHHGVGKLTNAGTRAPRDSALVAAVKAILDKTPIQLQPLPPSVIAQAFASPHRPAPPPSSRLYSFQPQSNTLVGDTTSEGSGEGEWEPRCASLPDSPSTPTEQMEFFVHRGLCLLWLVSFPVLVAVCAAYRDRGDALFWDHVLLEPAVALLGLLPFNAIVVGRVWGLWSNLVLISRLRWLLRRADDDSSDDENVDSGAVVLEVAEGKHDTWKVLRSLLRMLRVDGTASHLCFARSPVHVLGSATVLGSLDGEATLTEAVPVPLRVLYVKARPKEAPESDGSSDDARDGTEGLHPDLQALLEKQKHEAELYRRAQFYTTQRFQVLELHHTSNRSKIVSFVDPRAAANDTATSSLMPLGLCALLHSVHGTSALRGRDAPKSRDFIASQAMDATVMWGRCMHWLARAMDLPDGLAVGFRLLRRMLFFDRVAARKAVAHTSRPIPQKCGLLFESPSGELHLYVIGHISYVMESCSSCWDGGGVSALSDQDRQTSLTLTSRWPTSADVVGCSFRVLPERYREFLAVPSQPAAAASSVPSASATPAQGIAGGGKASQKWAHVAEDVFVDGHLVHSTHLTPHEGAAGAGRDLGGGELGRGLPFGKRRRNAHRRTWSVGEEGGGGLTTGSQATESPGLSPAAVATDAPVTREEKHNVPEFEPDSHLTQYNAVPLVMSCQQTFLGVVGLYDFVRPRVENSIRTLNQAGVRFVHFGSGTLQEVRSFGSRLGLKDEHNNCISLREHDPSIDDAYLRARLPRGVDDIRRHLVTTDTIPLKVPMFCGARSSRTRGMISVMQDNHEVVIALGSTYNHSNVRAMLQADIAIAAEPALKRGAAVDGDDIVNRQIDEVFFRPDADTQQKLQLLNRLLTTVCALKLTPTTQTLPMVVALIRQARLLLKQLAQATDFIVQCSCAVTLLQASMLIASGGPLFLPPSLTLVLLNLTVPMFAFGVAYVPINTNVMKLFPTKHDFASRVEMLSRWSLWFALRFLPTTVAMLLVGIGARASFGDDRMQPFAKSKDLDDTNDAVVACFAFSSIAMTYSFAWISMTFLSRHEFVPVYVFDAARRSKVRYALGCHRWLLFCGSGILVNLLFVCFICYDQLYLMARIPAWCFAFVALWPCVIIAVDIPLKKKRATVFAFEQKMLDLAFQTRLGMYSPVGSEDVGASEVDESHHAARIRTENCVVGAVRRWVSMDDGKGERQCVCNLRTDF